MKSIQIKKRIIRLSLLTLFVMSISFAANAKSSINGIVKDRLSGQRLPYSAVELFSFSDTLLHNGAMTDSEGAFTINNIPDGKYRLRASYMGYTKKEYIITVPSEKTIFHFLLSKNTIALNELEIIADKNLIAKDIEKVTINISKNTTLTGGTAKDVMQTLPSVDIDIDGIIQYRGSEKVIILINGEKTELSNNLDQIPAEQIERVELINNPSAKYDAEGMSGIINIVLKSGKKEKNQLTLSISAGYPENYSGNIGYTGSSKKTRYFVNVGMKHKTKFQTKEHLRKNYENPLAYDYYQYDYQDQILNSVFANTHLTHSINKRQKIGVSLIGTKKFNSAIRDINYKTLDNSGNTYSEYMKDIVIDINNYTIDGNLDYTYRFAKGKTLKTNFHYSYLEQEHSMHNDAHLNDFSGVSELQNTNSSQLNKKSTFAINYAHTQNDSLKFSIGYKWDIKDLQNKFQSESYDHTATLWANDTALENYFQYVQHIHSGYINMKSKLKYFDLQAGLRMEHTTNTQYEQQSDPYLDFFPSLSLSKRTSSRHTLFISFTRRINRPTIKMINPFTDEYADILNMHKGNPNLKPEYVNSVELGNQFIFKKVTGFSSIYYRDISNAISRIKSAADDSAFHVTFMNLDQAKLVGAEISLSISPKKWWSINTGGNLFYTELKGVYGINEVDNKKTGWNANLMNSFKLPYKFGLQLSAYYRSKLPSAMGIYMERYYMDLAISKKVLKNKGKLIFKVSDLFNTYRFGLDLNAIDENGYQYSQRNRRKNESQYFILSFVYNIKGKADTKKKEVFYLDKYI